MTSATRVLFLYAKDKRDPRLPCLFPFFSFATKCVQTETAWKFPLSLFLSLLLSLCITFEAATVNESIIFLLYEHRFYPNLGTSHNMKCDNAMKYMYKEYMCVDTNKDIL